MLGSIYLTKSISITVLIWNNNNEFIHQMTYLIINITPGMLWTTGAALEVLERIHLPD